MDWQGRKRISHRCVYRDPSKEGRRAYTDMEPDRSAGHGRYLAVTRVTRVTGVTASTTIHDTAGRHG
jgi:hypothetical protein